MGIFEVVPPLLFRFIQFHLWAWNGYGDGTGRFMFRGGREIRVDHSIGEG